MRCANGHTMHLIKLSVYRGHIHGCKCDLCGIDIPQPAPRHRCRRCKFHVCYDCGLRLAQPRGSGSSSDGAHQELQGESVTALRDKFWARVERRVQHRADHVAISKFYETVAPAQGTMRTRGHCRRRKAVAEDCHVPTYSDAALHLEHPSAEIAPTPGQRVEVMPEKDIWQEISADRVARPIEDCPGSAHALADAVLQRVVTLTDTVAAEGTAGQDCLSSDWQPMLKIEEATDPAAPGGPQKAGVLAWLLGGGNILDKLLELCAAAAEVMRQQPILSEVAVPAKVYGDVHGQLRDMVLLFHYYGWPGPSTSTDKVGGPQMSYVFNGDWVDRGQHQLEVVVILLALKIMYPNRVWLNRGNHEDLGQNLKTTREGNIGFDMACEDALGTDAGNRAFQAFHSVFEWLPLAARIGGRALVLHGGIGNGDWTLENLLSVKRPLTSATLLTALDGVVYNILWSDPLLADRVSPVETFGVHSSHRSKHNHVMRTFGRDVTERFCARERLSLIIRSHQFKRCGKGYELMHDGWLMRVFSARNYIGRHANDGGLLLVAHASGTSDTLLIRPQIIERMLVPEQSHSAASISEPYCPRAHLMHLVKPSDSPVGCMPFSRHARAETLVCAECGLQALEESTHYRCRGCLHYSLCIACANVRRVETPMPRSLDDESDWGTDSEDTSGFEEDEPYPEENEPDPEVSSDEDHKEELTLVQI